MPPPDPLSDPPSLLKDARRSAGLTQADLAHRLGVSQAAVAKLERPGANPTIATLWRRAAERRAAARAHHKAAASGHRRNAGIRAAQADPRTALRPVESMYEWGRELALTGLKRVTVPADYQPAALVRALVEGGVDFVIIGGVAIILQAMPRFTKALDIYYSTEQPNLDALSNVLTTLKARLLGIPEEVPFVPDARTLAQTQIMCLTTPTGYIDLLFNPDGAPPYARRTLPMSRR